MRSCTKKVSHLQTSSKLKPVPCELLLNLFPFGMLINPAMEIIGVGERLMQVWGEKSSILGHPVTESFRMRRPKGISFTWKNLFYLRSVMFSLEFLCGGMGSNSAEGSKTPETEHVADKKTTEMHVDQLAVSASNTIGRPISPYQLRRESNHGLRNILLKGQMRYIEDINAIMFLCSPV
ncbi:hypothetical protein ILUMI_19828 [Ignelater luminosus]|uniref:guanylate cyclase n=1 Tax=Ignelater luminosus TaxID=2038154 RepID=A0A8K0CM66_IGNLU|nr:hypothetical protein ILUMI_19828 [Ignelater luminosus]